MTRTVKLYGGPAHGREHVMCDDCRRIDVLPPRRTRTLAYCQLSEEQMRTIMLEECRREVTTYYVTHYSVRGFTQAGARVHQTLPVALWEDEKLTQREEYDLERATYRLPWEWDRKPNFLTQFDQWFEYEWCAATGTQPIVRDY